MKNITTYKTSNNVFYSCQYHVIWCPKYRRKVLIEGVDERLKSIILDVALQTNSEVLEMEVNPDYVHLLVSVDPQYGVNSVVKRMKGASSRILRKEYSWLKSRIPSLWTNSYFVCTVGGATMEVIQQYIENQKNV